MRLQAKGTCRPQWALVGSSRYRRGRQDGRKATQRQNIYTAFFAILDRSSTTASKPLRRSLSTLVQLRSLVQPELQSVLSTTTTNHNASPHRPTLRRTGNRLHGCTSPRRQLRHAYRASRPWRHIQYSGDGTTSDGWPSQSEWIDYTDMW
jgi:hypothetical protein